MAEPRRDLLSRTQIIGCIRQGNELQRKYATTGSVDDLQRARKAYEEGLESSNDPYLRAVCLNNMGSALESLFDETHLMDYLNQAIDSKKQAADLIPVNHQQRASFFDGYSGLLQVRLEHSGSMDDLNEAIMAVEEAIRLTPERTSEACMYLNNFSIALRSRFKRTSVFGDLERAVAVAKLAVESVANNPNRRYHLNGLGIALDMQFEWTGSLEHQDRKSTRLNSSHTMTSRMPSSA